MRNGAERHIRGIRAGRAAGKEPEGGKEGEEAPEAPPCRCQGRPTRRNCSASSVNIREIRWVFPSWLIPSNFAKE